MSVAKHEWEAEVLILDQRERARVARQARGAEVRAAVAEERAAIVAWLRESPSAADCLGNLNYIADAIERRDHHE